MTVLGQKIPLYREIILGWSDKRLSLTVTQNARNAAPVLPKPLRSDGKISDPKPYNYAESLTSPLRSES